MNIDDYDLDREITETNNNLKSLEKMNIYRFKLEDGKVLELNKDGDKYIACIHYDIQSSRDSFDDYVSACKYLIKLLEIYGSYQDNYRFYSSIAI